MVAATVVVVVSAAIPVRTTGIDGAAMRRLLDRTAIHRRTVHRRTAAPVVVAAAPIVVVAMPAIIRAPTAVAVDAHAVGPVEVQSGRGLEVVISATVVPVVDVVLVDDDDGVADDDGRRGDDHRGAMHDDGTGDGSTDGHVSAGATSERGERNSSDTEIHCAFHIGSRFLLVLNPEPWAIADFR